MHNDRGLSASVLMALQNLCLNEEELARLRHGVIEALRKAPLEHVAAFVWFLLSTATPTTNDEVSSSYFFKNNYFGPASLLSDAKLRDTY